MAVGTGREYELFCADELKKYGFRNIEMTKASGDYGVDIVCEKKGERWAVQCKYYSSHVGVAAIQQATAGKAMYGCDRAMIITNSGFTAQAKELALKNDVELWKGLEPRENVGKIFLCVVLFCYALTFLAIAVSRAAAGETFFWPLAFLCLPVAMAAIIKGIKHIIRRRKK